MKLNATVDRRLVPAAETSDRYLRVQIHAPEQSSSRSRLPLNLALVIDRSGSMSGSKLEKAKEAAIFCLRNLTSTDRAAVIAYDDEVRVVAPSRILSAEVKNHMIGQVRSIQSGGSTNLGGGWLTGAQEVANHQHEASYLSRAILLSDGLANVGLIETPELAHHAAELRQRGVSTTTLGIGADFNEDLLEQMAIRGGGHFYFIEHARQIPDFLHRELGEVLSTCARKVVLELHLPGGVEAHLHNTFETERMTDGVRVRLDDMIGGEVRSLVFKLSVQSGPLAARLPLDLQLSYLDVESSATRQVSNHEMVLTYASRAESSAQTPDAAVQEEAALLEVAQAREEALRLDAAGDYARSAATLAGAADYLRMAAPASPGAQREAALLDSESTQAEQGLGNLGRKAVHYNKTSTQQNRQR